MTPAAAPSKKLAMRPVLPRDVPLLAEIFRAGIFELTGDDYSQAQQEAWASAADDEAAFAARLAKQLVLLATIDGEPAGFAALEGTDRLDFLYVHPEATRQGVASMLCDAFEKLAAARGANKLTAEVSDTANGFFQRRGFVAQRRNTVQYGEEWLANTTMEKPLTKGTP